MVSRLREGRICSGPLKRRSQPCVEKTEDIIRELHFPSCIAFATLRDLTVFHRLLMTVAGGAGQSLLPTYWEEEDRTDLTIFLR